MQYVGDVFISEILKKPILDQFGKELGLIKDFSITAGQIFPQVKSVILKKKGHLFQLPEHLVKYFNANIISAIVQENSLTEYDANNKDDILASRDVLDQQIVDVDGIKIVRVNDIKLGKVKNKLSLVAVDTDLRGLLRRLGFEKWADRMLRTFGIKLTDDLVAWNYIQPLEMRLSSLSLTVPKQNISTLHPSDIAQLISEVSHSDKEALFNYLTLDVAAEALHELDPDLQASIIMRMDKKTAKNLLEKMPPDEAADVIGDLPKSKADELLSMMEEEEAEDVIELLEHDDDSAGGLMTTDFITLSPDSTVEDSLKEWRLQAPDIEGGYNLYVTDKEEKLLGFITLKDLLLAKGGAIISSIMKPPLKIVRPSDDKMLAAETISKYNLLSIPVVDEKSELLGVITVDDVVDILLPPESRRKKQRITGVLTREG